MFTLSRLTLAAAIMGLLLAGCADHPATRATTSTSTTTAPSRSSDSSTRHSETTTRSSSTHTSARATSSSDQPESTGIAACDDYLSSYIACHRAAKIYSPDQLPSRYEAMRTSLLRDSQNPDIRPQLGARCNSLASQLRQALHGKSCASTPASSSSTP